MSRSLPVTVSLLVAVVFTFDRISSDSSSSYLTNTRSTRLVNRTRFGSATECSIRLGGKQFTSKFYRMITCRYVANLSVIYPYLLEHSNDITALEITDSTIDQWNIDEYPKAFRRFQFLILHRTRFLQQSACPFNTIAPKLFYLHLAHFSPSLEHVFVNRSCSPMKQLHVLILDHTPLGDENLLREKFPHVHVLRLNFSSFSQPLNSSYLRAFPYLQDFFFKTNDDCHRCEYEWLKYASRDENYARFRVSPHSGCMDWNRNGQFMTWQHAPLCGSCSLPLLSRGLRGKELCRVEDGITEHYCKAFYGRESLFTPWTNVFDKKTKIIGELPSTVRPYQEFMKPKFTPLPSARPKREVNTTVRTLPVILYSWGSLTEFLCTLLAQSDHSCIQHVQ